MLPDRTQRLQNLGDVETRWQKRGDTQPGDVKVGDGPDFFLHITDRKTLLQVLGAALQLTDKGSALQPGGRLSLQVNHALVDFNGLSFNPLATEPSTAVLPVPTLVQSSPLMDDDLQLLQGVVRTLESLRGVL